MRSVSTAYNNLSNLLNRQVGIIAREERCVKRIALIGAYPISGIADGTLQTNGTKKFPEAVNFREQALYQYHSS